MADHLIRSLTKFAPFRPAELELIERLQEKAESFGARTDVILEGDQPTKMFIVEEGLMMRYRILSDGRRQILTFLIPGDMCDVNIFFAHAMDHSISAVGPSRIRRVARDDILRLCLGNPRFAGAFWWSSLQREAMLRERVVALGRRNARARLAYLFCEFYWRYEAIDQVLDHTLVLPLTQAELGDTLGMTAIHVNRVLSDMRDDGLLQRSRARIELTDFEGLKALAEIDREYLHYSAPPPEVAAYFRESAA